MILLVDNRDSYTFNLAQLIAKVTGCEPEVVRADEVDVTGTCEAIRRGRYSHIVISPGPGTPESDADFAGSRAVIEAAATIPLLGVCLGHQGLAHLAGVPVGRTEPHHGHVSSVTHTGQGIFAGLPQGFAVVRYHSLCVEAGSANEAAGGAVRVHARSEDGVVQGLEIVGRPHWGVQFHPESVLTEHGEELLANFFRLSARPWSIAHEQVNIELDVEGTFRALRRADEDSFWLDSATGDGFSIMGTTAGPVSETVSFRVGDAGPDILQRLDTELARGIDTSELPDHLPFTGGWVGYLGYECAALTLPGFSPRHRSAQPDAYFVRPQSFLVYDHARRHAHLMALYDEDSAPQAAELMGALKRALRAAGPSAPASVPPARVHSPTWRISREQYLSNIARAKQALAAGDSYEVCLTDTVHGQTDAGTDGLDLYARLRRANPAPYAAYLNFGTVEVLSSSPERFLRVRGREVETKPIKGTIARSHPPELLARDPKTRAENLMIVDLLRNDLGRVCCPGTVNVPRLMQVETYATVHQLVSTVTGSLRPGVGLIDLIRATFPGGSMTGAPKERTCAIIDALEAGPRGIYSGAIGYLGFDGSADLSVVIRTAVKDGGEVTVGAGGAIVWDSDPNAEVDEARLKADAVLEGLQ